MLRPRIRRRCVSLAAAPADSWLHTARDNRDTETMERLVTQNSAQRGRPAVPDHWTGRPGGSGAQPPLHLIYYGQSRTYTVFDFGLPLLHMYSSTLGLIAMCH